jgi:hypothetical protein
LQLSIEAWEAGESSPNLYRSPRGKCFKLRVRDSSTADRATRERWAVNYARHHLTNYGRDIESATEQSEAISAIRHRVLDAIAEQWPEPRDECRRQR